jgi:hypothetical protein
MPVTWTGAITTTPSLAGGVAASLVVAGVVSSTRNLKSSVSRGLAAGAFGGSGVIVILLWLAGAVGGSDAAHALVATISKNNRHGFISSRLRRWYRLFLHHFLDCWFNILRSLASRMTGLFFFSGS